MIKFEIVGNKSQCFEIAQKLHDGLVGRPAYVNSEIFINYTDDRVFLVVGHDNWSDICYIVNADSFTEADET